MFITSCVCLAAFESLALPFTFGNLVICLGAGFFGFFLCGTLWASWNLMSLIPQVRGIFSHCFLKKCSALFSSPPGPLSHGCRLSSWRLMSLLSCFSFFPPAGTPTLRMRVPRVSEVPDPSFCSAESVVSPLGFFTGAVLCFKAVTSVHHLLFAFVQTAALFTDASPVFGEQF